MDFSSKLNAMTTYLNETPKMGALPSAPHISAIPATETIQQAKASEFPVMPRGIESKKKIPKSK